MTSIASVTCRHHWIIESARGPTSGGMCKLCGEKKGFYNSWEDFLAHWQRTRPMELPELPQIELDRQEYGK